MATISLRIHIVEADVTKTLQFDPSTSVHDACNIIREKILEAGRGEAKDYGLFLADEDTKKGVWLEPGRNLEYYILRNGDMIDYRKKIRTLKVQMLDGAVKTMLIDDSQPVANLMVVICTKLGITNHDEYGLVRESNEDEVDNSKSSLYGTLTLRRKREEKDRDIKMEQLRKKLKTDDELNWIDVSKTLGEQGIHEGEPVWLRRKFFFSDGNIDSHDPVQLNLLYVQARDAILNGTHPVTEELACQLAGIQVHVQFGNHNEAKHKAPFLDLKEFLPQSYVKVRNIEKKIFAEHKKHYDLSELDAKLLYTKTCRSLPTFGVTFFLVKEKMKGKNKLVPRLLGVNKDSVLRLDEKTKEILKTWPLTTVKRWGASPNTFTLDFGDYSDQYFSVQTKEAEQIAQIISGYIDIILKKKQAKDHFGIEGDEGSTMVEETVSPSKASILQHENNKVNKVNTESVAKPAIMRAGVEGSKPYGTGHVGAAQYTTISGQINVAHAPVVMQQTQVDEIMTAPQRALLSKISSSHETIRIVETELTQEVIISDTASQQWKETAIKNNKQSVSSRLAAMNAATAQIISMTSGEMNYVGVEKAINSITTNLPEVSQGVRMIAALRDDGEQLLDATRTLCAAFTNLLNTVEPATTINRQRLLTAATDVGEASRRMITEMNERKDESKEVLLSLAESVATSTAVLVIKAKSVAASVDQQQQTAIINATTRCALATSQLVACTKVVASTVENASCREQLVMAAKEVMNSMEELISVSGHSVTEENNGLLRELITAVAEVTTTLNRLINQVKTFKTVTHRSVKEETETETVSVTEHYENQSKLLNGVRSDQHYTDEEFSSHKTQPVKYYTATVTTHVTPNALGRGIQACNNAASAVSGIVGDVDTIIMFATAGALHAEKENETFSDHRENILRTAKALVEDTKTLVTGAASSQEHLAIAAQSAVSTITQLAEVVKYGAASLGADNPESQVMLLNAVKDVAEALGDLIQATKSASGKGMLNLLVILVSLRYYVYSARCICGGLTAAQSDRL